MTNREKQRALSELKDWAAKQRHFPKCSYEDEELLNAFTAGCSLIDLAKLKLDAYFTLRGQYEKLYFSNRDPKKIRWFSVKKSFFLPGKTPDGDHVMFVLPPRKEQEYYYPEESVKLYFMILDSYLREYHEKQFNFYILIDMGSLSGEKMEKLSKEYSRECSEIMEAYPIRIKGIISFNTTTQGESFCEQVFKPFCNESINQKVFIEKGDHTSVAKYIPLEMLSQEYEGGKNPPINVLWDGVKQRLERERNWFLTNGSQKTKEALRL